MFEIDKIPEHIRKSARDKGVDVDRIYLTAYCDMNRDHTYCDTYLIATADTLYVLSGCVGLTPKGNQSKGVQLFCLLFQVYDSWQEEPPHLESLV